MLQSKFTDAKKNPFGGHVTPHVADTSFYLAESFLGTRTAFQASTSLVGHRMHTIYGKEMM